MSWRPFPQAGNLQHPGRPSVREMETRLKAFCEAYAARVHQTQPWKANAVRMLVSYL